MHRHLVSGARACVSSPLNVLITAGILDLGGADVAAIVCVDPDGCGVVGRLTPACAGVDAGCWLFIRAHASQILVGAYPAGDRWRVLVCFVVGVGLFGLVAMPWRWGRFRSG